MPSRKSLGPLYRFRKSKQVQPTEVGRNVHGFLNLYKGRINNLIDDPCQEAHRTEKSEAFMNRAQRVIKHLEAAPSKTLTLFQLEKLMVTDWPPRAINEARNLGAVISGNNPYILVSFSPEIFTKKSSKKIVKEKPRYEFDPVRQVYIQI